MKKVLRVIAAAGALALLAACNGGSATSAAPAASSRTTTPGSAGTRSAGSTTAAAPDTAALAVDPIGSTTGATSPSPQDVPVLVVHPLTGEADFGVIEPTEMAYSIDVNATIVDITWSSWTATGATGQGSRVRDDCNPDCAHGTITLVPTTITLGDPVGGQFTSLTETSDGQTQTLTGTGLIEGAGVNPAKLPVPIAAPGLDSADSVTAAESAPPAEPATAAGPDPTAGSAPGTGYNDPDFLAEALLADEVAKGIAAQSVTCVVTAPQNALCQLTVSNSPYPIPAHVVVSPDGGSYTITGSG